MKTKQTYTDSLSKIYLTPITISLTAEELHLMLGGKELTVSWTDKRTGAEVSIYLGKEKIEEVKNG